ncbi:hypothetical protein V6N12_042363 [Hibiscus sabdariffa]|uniref:Uncharacterized protein n=1 Tax=Hibiscus sabdariffa TaxID=183260 RepID=A0ABR2EG80_9ROSI
MSALVRGKSRQNDTDGKENRKVVRSIHRKVTREFVGWSNDNDGVRRDSTGSLLFFPFLLSKSDPRRDESSSFIPTSSTH